MANRISGASSRQIMWRYIVEGDLILDTPAHFGSGDSSGTEMIILQDALEGLPLLPGTSIAGALRHYLHTRLYGYRHEVENDQSVVATLFGEANEEENYGIQSRVIVDDALGNKTPMSIREQVKIDPEKSLADDGALFSFQVWPIETTFRLRFELEILQGDVHDNLLKGFLTALLGLAQGEIPLGARKNRGLGRFHMKNWRMKAIDTQQSSHLLWWLREGGQPLSGQSVDKLQDLFDDSLPQFYDHRRFVRIDSAYRLCDSMLIRSESEMVHLQTNGVPVVSGSSLAGAIRARASKIAQTIQLPNAETVINDMFGQFGGDGNAPRDQQTLPAGRVLVQEHFIDGGVTGWVQNRVKIDRFTGGAVDKALFDQQPVFGLEDTRVYVCVELRIPDKKSEKYHELLHRAQIGLLFLVLKDLWTEDVVIGGDASVGRGRLSGEFANITIQHDDVKHIELQRQTQEIRVDYPAVLEAYVEDLYEYIKGGASV